MDLSVVDLESAKCRPNLSSWKCRVRSGQSLLPNNPESKGRRWTCSDFTSAGVKADRCKLAMLHWECSMSGWEALEFDVSTPTSVRVDKCERRPLGYTLRPSTASTVSLNHTRLGICQMHTAMLQHLRSCIPTSGAFA